MTDETLRETWEDAVPREPADRAGCPAPEMLLALAEGRPADRPIAGEGGELDALADTAVHLAGCRACRRDLDLARTLLQAAGEAAGGAADGEPPGSLPARPAGSPSAGKPHGAESRLAARPGGGGRFRPWAIAASLVVAGGTGLALWTLAGGDDILRSGAAPLGAPGVTCPVPGEVRVAWSAVEEATRYRVELFTEAGEVVLRRETPEVGLHFLLPDDLAGAGGERPTDPLSGAPRAGDPGASGLAEGPALFVRVEVLRPGARPLMSPATPLPASCLPGQPPES